MAIGRRRPPGVADEETGRAIGIGQRVAVGGGAQETAAVGVSCKLIPCPWCGLQMPALTAQAGVGVVGTAAPYPIARCVCHDANPKGASAVPEAVDALLEVRALQIYPYGTSVYGFA